MVISRPPMGWNSWNTFTSDINEKLIMETADAMAELGMPGYGYDYLVIDDCWSKRERNAEGRLEADPEKFPHGMKYVADYVHSKGLKFGMYSCAGTMTCARFPGSYGHEFADAETFASWGVDFLKYDYCYRDKNVPGEVLYRRMGLALENCGRDILYSACNWGADESQNWIKTTGAHMWRSTGDISDCYLSVKNLIQKQFALFPTNGHGCFNDMDMLVVGMNGKGKVSKEGELMSFEEYKTHFSAWALFGSPLIIGCDIRQMTDETKRILFNRDVIAIDQDPAGRQVFRSKSGSDEKFIAFRFLDGGDIAVGMFNLSDTLMRPNSAYAPLTEIGLDVSFGRTLHLRELWTGEEYDVRNEVIIPKEPIEPHSCRLYRASVTGV